MKQRLLSVFLALTMLLSLMPTAAFAAEHVDGTDNSEIVYEIHPGIGSIDDILPLSSPFGITPGLTYTGSYYDQLDVESKALYDAIYNSDLKDGPTTKTVTFTEIPFSNDEDRQNILWSAIAALLYDHPELSWLVNTEFSTGRSGNNLISFALSGKGYECATTDPNGLVTAENRSYANTGNRADIMNKVEAAKKEIGDLSGKSDYEKVKALYDWVCNNMEYAHYRESDPAYSEDEAAKFQNGWRGYQTAYSALVEGVTVCAGYAKSFKLLCDAYNIPCAIVAGRSSNQNHAWNYVQVGGNWYAIDCTWADQSTYISYNYLLKGKTNFTDHTEGTLYSECNFKYPELSMEDYKDPNAPDSIEISYPPGLGQTSDKHPAVAVPSIETLGVPTSKEVQFTAVAKGDDGSPISNQAIEWSLASGFDGVTLQENADGSATLTISNSAMPFCDEGYGYYVTVTASCATTSASQKISVYVPARTAKFVEIYKDSNAITADTITQGDSSTYTAKVYDKYGAPMDGAEIYGANGEKVNRPTATVTWSVTGGTGVSVNDGLVSVDADAAAGDYTVTATSGSANASVTVTVPKAGHKHTWDTKWSYDNTNHWHDCTASDCPENDNSKKDGYAAHTWDAGEETKPATCTEPGEKLFTCECGQTKTESIPTIEHNFSTEWSTDNDHHWHVCTVCRTASTKVAHTSDQGTETKAPTCTETGEKTFSCTECGLTIKTETLEATGHTWDSGTQTKAPTCTETGVKTFTCTECKSTKTDPIAATGHQWSTTWEKDGTNHWHVCANCTETSATAAHSFNSGVITIQPTFEKAGEKTYTCTTCQYQKTEAVAKLEHQYSNIWSKDENKHWHACTDEGYTTLKADEADHSWDAGKVTTEPTYAAPGEKTITCTVCGQTKTEPIAQLVHNYSDQWSKDNDNHWHACIDEGFTNLKKDEAAHTWTKDEGRSTPATDDTDGKNVYICFCGAEKEETVGATGHNYSTDWSHNETEHWHACTDAGCDKVSGKAPHSWTVRDGSTTQASHTEAGSRTLECVCGETKTEVLPKHTVSPLWSSDETNHWHACTEAGCTEKDNLENHSWDEGVTTTPPTLTSTGVKTYTCSVCQKTKLETIAQLEHTYSTEWSKDNDYHWHACTDTGYESLTKDKAPHTWDSGTVTTEPTTETEGVRTYTCTVCGQTRTESIGQLGHNYSTEWSKDATHHWHACTDEGCQAVSDRAEHIYDNDADTTCNTCGYVRTITPAAGFTITFDANGGVVSPLSLVTGADGKLISLPVPSRSSYTFNGWYTSVTGGIQITTSTVFSADTTVYARWTYKTPSTPNGGGSGSGGSSSTPSMSIKVPVSGDNNSVQVNATVSGSTATISKLDTTQLNTVAGSDVRTGMVEVDLSGLNRTIQTVNLPADTIKKIAIAAADVDNDTKGLTIKLSTAEASFDAAALNEIQKQAGSRISLTIAPARPSALNTRQKDTVGDAPVYDLTMTSGSKTITDFGGGYVTVSLPYKLEQGQNPTGIVVYYLDSSGNIHACETMYDVRTETVIFTTGHLSLYFVGYDQTAVSTEPEEVLRNPFTDVLSGVYYYDAVIWAAANGITGGTTATTFSPDSVCTRAQVATFLWRAAGSPEPQYTGVRFTDVQADAYYYKAVLWATEQGITTGTSETTFSPDAVVTRAQAVTFLYRAADAPAVNGNSSFADVLSDAYYANAVQWAVAEGITVGTGATAFSPDSDCTRAQIATFLYRSQAN